MNRKLKSGSTKARKKKEDDLYAAILKRASAVSQTSNTRDDSAFISDTSTMTGPYSPTPTVETNSTVSNPKPPEPEPEIPSPPPEPVSFTAFPTFDSLTKSPKNNKRPPSSNIKTNVPKKTSATTKDSPPAIRTPTGPSPIVSHNTDASRTPLTFGFTQSKKQVKPPNNSLTSNST